MTAAHLAAQHPATDVKSLEKEIADQKEKQENAVAKEDYEAALNAKVRIEELQKQIDNHTEGQKVTATVNDVAESVERLTGVPVSNMGASDIERLKELASRLKDKVIGQDEAVEAVSRAFVVTVLVLTKVIDQLVVSSLSVLLALVRQSLLNN